MGRKWKNSFMILKRIGNGCDGDEAGRYTLEVCLGNKLGGVSPQRQNA